MRAGCVDIGEVLLPRVVAHRDHYVHMAFVVTMGSGSLLPRSAARPPRRHSTARSRSSNWPRRPTCARRLPPLLVRDRLVLADAARGARRGGRQSQGRSATRSGECLGGRDGDEGPRLSLTGCVERGCAAHCTDGLRRPGPGADHGHLSGRAPDRRASRRSARRDPRQPGRGRRRRDRVGQEHPAAEDVPRARARTRHGWIGHTQPRRIAARSIAERVAEELGRRGRRRRRLQGAVHRQGVEEDRDQGR